MIEDHHDIEALIRRVVSEAVPASVNETLIKIGVDIKDPLKVQQDMAFLRTLRTSAGAFAALCLGGFAAGLIQFWHWISTMGVPGRH